MTAIQWIMPNYMAFLYDIMLYHNKNHGMCLCNALKCNGIPLWKVHNGKYNTLNLFKGCLKGLKEDSEARSYQTYSAS